MAAATADLLDITDLVSGWYKPTLDSIDEDKQEIDGKGCEAFQLPAEPTYEELFEAGLIAVNHVLSVYPDADWIVAGEYGRIVQGDRLISLPMSLIDDTAEFLAWIDASKRLGDGNQWSGCTRHHRLSERVGN